MASLLNTSTTKIDDGWFDDEDPDKKPAPISPDPHFEFTSILEGGDMLPESRPILLPSNFSQKDRKQCGLQALADKEVSLRKGQANDALQAIHLGIGEKSFCFRNQLRPANSKGLKTRAWTLINNAGKKLQQQQLLYRQAQRAMENLGETELIMMQYKELSNKDMKTSTAMQETNAQGQQNVELSWIWTMKGVFNSDEGTFITECELILFSLI